MWKAGEGVQTGGLSDTKLPLSLVLSSKLPEVRNFTCTIFTDLQLVQFLLYVFMGSIHYSCISYLPCSLSTKNIYCVRSYLPDAVSGAKSPQGGQSLTSWSSVWGGRRVTEVSN